MDHSSTLKSLKECHTVAGNVFLLAEKDNSKTVLVQRYISEAPWIHSNKTYNFKDAELALAKFEEVENSLLKRPPYKCSANWGANICACDNCPAQLGGADYWRLFRDVCLYRTR